MKNVLSRSILVVLGSIGALILASCALSGRPAGFAAAQPAAPTTAPADQTTAPALPVLTISPSKPTVGSEVRATAEGLPANRSVELIWKTVQGGWVIEDYYHFRGKKFSETSEALGRAMVGPDGRLDAKFTIPEDYGGVHDVLVAADGVPLAQGGVEVVQTFELHPAAGPIGTPIEVRAKGLGWRTMESTWVVNWDNREVGWVSAVNTRGTAIARFRATGPVGEHLIKLYSGYMGQSYLNYEQAPTAYLPRPQFTFRTTPGGSVPPAYADPYQPQPVPLSESQIEARLEVSPTQGPVLTQATLRGEDLPANTAVALVWETWVGSRVTQSGFAPKETRLAELNVAADGRLEAPVIIPDDLGGLHALVLKTQDTVLARTYFVIETSIVSISPTAGPVGTPVTIQLKGVGWTEYDNIYVATYDNAYMGYACGFNSQGGVTINFTATGEPGMHLIDLYPGLYQGPAEGQQLYRLPQLTYADDHPGNTIPALRFAFEITKE
jgi:hypothetical protein